MKNKAIIFDLDGTAVDSPEKKLPTERLVSAIEKLKNDYYFSAATGRVWSFGKHILHGLKLTDPCIISGGTQICDPVSGKILWQKNVPERAIKDLLEIFKRYTPDYNLLYNDGTEDDYFHGGVLPKDFSTDEPIYFLEQVFVPDALALEVYEKLIQVPGVAVIMAIAQKPGMRDIHFLNESATKEHAVAELLRILNVDQQNTIGLGDGHNDLHLFNAVHHKVAMGNAVPELKTVADEVIGHIKKDGMAEYLEKLAR